MIAIRLFAFIFTLTFVMAVPKPLENPKYKEFDTCGGDRGFPQGVCRYPQHCCTIIEYLTEKNIQLNDVPSCGFNSPFEGKMICCPKTDTQRTTSGPPIFRFTGTHLVTMRYFKNEHLDEFVYHCTGVLLSSSQVLASKQCAGEEGEEIFRPSRVMLGSQDARVDDESNIKKDIKKLTSYKNDLVLIKLRTTLNKTQLMGNVSIAKLCDPVDLQRNPNFFAAAYSYNTDENESCTKFTMQLQNLNLKECKNVKVTRQIEDLATDQSHFCFRPLPTFERKNECSKCLTATSSVLHVERMDGTQCVAGIATPTKNECIEEDTPLYFTNILRNSVYDFLNSE
ncbi:uncharacterized protein LOC133848606 [Drosophila sulfurigaster albostrigata]|uniref:uncharacterized protein LOC133848606 n=1 Tax=Drosophila sulfurigaster albostrigata TaxID=89887 RepID=UPI002D218B1C|nr:uncharacterized protein LOC133848606 [Drosophila sulfurigaster albostrigata]